MVKAARARASRPGDPAIKQNTVLGELKHVLIYGTASSYSSPKARSRSKANKFEKFAKSRSYKGKHSKSHAANPMPHSTSPQVPYNA